MPRAPLVVSFHPRADTPFTLDHLRAALRAGAHGAELDLRWREADAAVVCTHDVRDLDGRPMLAEALDAILQHQGSSPSVQRDGRQFYVTLDLKEAGDPYHRAIIAVLRDRAARWSTSVRPGDTARGVTVVVSGMSGPLERSARGGDLESLCIVEGRNLDRRILDLSGRDGPLGWVALQHPTTRERIRALHEGRDAQYPGRYNVRVFGAGPRYHEAIAMVSDAVNADLAEIARARERGAARPTIATTDESGTTSAAFWAYRDWEVAANGRAKFEAGWRSRAATRRPGAKGWRGELLLRSAAHAGRYRVVERWVDRGSWTRALPAGRSASSELAALGGRAGPDSTMAFFEVEDRLGAGPVAGDHVRFYHITVRPGTARAFHRAWRRANDAIRAAHPAALGASLLREPGQVDKLLEIVRWKSESDWRGFIDSAPPDADADAFIRMAIGRLETERYEAIDIVP